MRDENEAGRHETRVGKTAASAHARQTSRNAETGSERLNQTVAGFLWVTAAMFFLAGIAAFARFATKSGIDPLQVLFFRNFFCVLWMLPLFAWRGLSLVQTDQLQLYGTRIAISFISMAAMFQAYALIPIGQVTAITFLSPMFGTLFAIFLLGETVHARRWIALGAGFAGAMVILRPGTAAFGAGEAFALVSAMAIGIIGPLVKKLTLRDDPDRIVFLTNLFMTPLALIPAIFVWTWPEPEMWLPLAGLGLAAVLGHMALVRGYAAIEASLVMAFKFSRLPFAVVIGYLVFGEGLDAATWIGAAIILSSAVYITKREQRLAKRNVNAALPPPAE